MKQHIYNSMVGLIAAFLLVISLHAAGQKNELTFLQNSVENYTKNNFKSFVSHSSYIRES